ncbi:MAG TPA: phosphatase PAP2 family protein [Bdellovibrionota bacterium]|nr:phosphatase PAP2 family protein [Bdellovibrionota bacterium]
MTVLISITSAQAAEDFSPGSFELPPHPRFTAFRQSLLAEQAALIAGTTFAASFLAYRLVDTPLGVDGSAGALGPASQWISDIGNYLPFALPVGFFAAGQFFEKGSLERSEAFKTAQELAEAIALTYGTTIGLKYAVGRTRPNGQDDASFPSGHASMAFAAAGVLAQRFPWYVGVPSVAFASAVGFTRLDLGKHYLSDVAVGAGLGLFFATTVHLYHSNLSFMAHKPSQQTVVPMVAKNILGLSFTGTF